MEPGDWQITLVRFLGPEIPGRRKGGESFADAFKVSDAGRDIVYDSGKARNVMIVDRIENSTLYTRISNGIETGLQFLKALPAVDFSDQRIEIAGESVFARFQRYTTTPRDGRLFEAHRRYIDIQYIAGGSEKILVTDLNRLTEHTPYDQERDVAFYEQTAGTEVLLRTGDFAIFFPQDAHLPMIPADDPAQVRKVVVKVAV